MQEDKRFKDLPGIFYHPKLILHVKFLADCKPWILKSVWTEILFFKVQITIRLKGFQTIL